MLRLYFASSPERPESTIEVVNLVRIIPAVHIVKGVWVWLGDVADCNLYMDFVGPCRAVTQVGIELLGIRVFEYSRTVLAAKLGDVTYKLLKARIVKFSNGRDNTERRIA
jgi:hypothetical protein